MDDSEGFQGNAPEEAGALQVIVAAAECADSGCFRYSPR